MFQIFENIKSAIFIQSQIVDYMKNSVLYTCTCLKYTG